MVSAVHFRTLLFFATGTSGTEKLQLESVSDNADADEDILALPQHVRSSLICALFATRKLLGGCRARIAQPPSGTDFYSEGFNLIFGWIPCPVLVRRTPNFLGTRPPCPEFLWPQATKTDKDEAKDKP